MGLILEQEYSDRDPALESGFLSNYTPTMRELLNEYLPDWLALLVMPLVAAALVLGFMGGSALFYIWAERKVSARMQDRLGPTRVGRFGRAHV